MKVVSVTVLVIAGLVMASANSWSALADTRLVGTTLDQSIYSVPSSSGPADGPAAEADRYLLRALHQVQEIIRLAQQGNLPIEAIDQGLQHSLSLALQSAAQLSDEALAPWLDGASQMVQAQQQLLKQAQAQIGGATGEALQHAYKVVSRAQTAIQDGLRDPEVFRHAWGPNQSPGNDEAPPATVTPGPRCDGPDCQPEGDQHQHGPQPERPGSGQPGGNPDGTCGDCQPEGDQHQHGPQPEQPGPGQPGGNPDGKGTNRGDNGDNGGGSNGGSDRGSSNNGDSGQNGGSGGNGGDGGASGGGGGGGGRG